MLVLPKRDWSCFAYMDDDKEFERVKMLLGQDKMGAFLLDAFLVRTKVMVIIVYIVKGGRVLAGKEK